MENKEKNSVSELMETTMTKIREMVDSNSVIGEPITTPDGVTLIPVSRVSLGFGSGGGTYSQPFELQYKGRIDKPVPSWALWVFKTEAGQKFMKFYHSHSFALGALIAEKIRILIEDNIKK